MKIPIFDVDINCPMCGFTHLIDFYCTTCEKHFIFKYRDESKAPVLLEKDDIVYVLDA